MKKYKLILLLLCHLFTTINAQNSKARSVLKPIPDLNFKNELLKQGYVTNDSLDLRKIDGLLQLEMNGKSIENLDGLQYFLQVWNLSIYDNKIKQLVYLPPNLTNLNCEKNEIKVLKNLPLSLNYLQCANNNISNITSLPPHLIFLDYSNNEMKQIPKFPTSLQHINYANNPTPFDSLPKLFKNIDCTDRNTNCMPYELMQWKILNATIKDTSLKITGMAIKLTSNHSWGLGTSIDSIYFKVKGTKLVADTMIVRRNCGRLGNLSDRDTTYVNKIKYSVKVSQINQFVKDIYYRKMIVQIPIGDSIKLINLKNKKNGGTVFFLMGFCNDCTYSNLEYCIYNKSNTIKLNFGFNDAYENGVLVEGNINGLIKEQPQEIKIILDWLYIYRLTNLTIPRHPITSAFFNKTNLDAIIKWAK